MEFQWNIRLFSRCFCWRSHAHHAQVQTKSAGSATRAYLLSVGLASTAAPAVLLVSSVRRLSCGKVIPPRRLAGPSREPHCYLARWATANVGSAPKADFHCSHRKGWSPRRGRSKWFPSPRMLIAGPGSWRRSPTTFSGISIAWLEQISARAVKRLFDALSEIPPHSKCGERRRQVVAC